MDNDLISDNGTDFNFTEQLLVDAQLLDALNSVQSKIGQFFIVALFLLGTVGNILLFCACMQTKLRRQSYSYFLRVLMVFDTANLFISLIDELFKLQPDAFFYSLEICKLWKYFSEVCGTMSWWLTASLSCERFMILYHPRRGRVFCSLTHVTAVITVLIASSLVLHVHALLVTTHTRGFGCHPMPGGWFGELEVFVYKTLGYLAPTIIIVACNCFVVRKVNRVRVCVKYADFRPAEVQCRFQRKRSEVTVMMLIITSASVFASMPSQIGNLFMYLGGEKIVSVDYILLNSLLGILQATLMVGYSCNFYAYILFSKFRKHLHEVCRLVISQFVCSIVNKEGNKLQAQPGGAPSPLRIGIRYNEADQQRVNWDRQMINYQYQVWLMNTPNRPLLALST